VPELISNHNSHFEIPFGRPNGLSERIRPSNVQSRFDGPSLWHPAIDDVEEQALIPMTESVTRSGLKVELLPEYKMVESETTMDVVARVSTMGVQSRAPIDLVAVIDKSASMKGEKIAMVKRILQFILTKLTVHDRLSIVTFDKHVYGLAGLHRCDGSDFLRDRIANSEHLIPHGGTNIKAGLERGLKILTDRRERNPITSMLLLTDGMGVVPSDEELNQLPPIPIHCFGIGTDHDARILNKIAEKTTGSYAFIEQTHEIRDTIALCLGSLLSIVGQDVKLTISAPQLKVSTSYPVTSTESSATVTIPNILFEEHKDILFSCQIATELCSVTGSYRDPINEHHIDPVHCIIQRGAERDVCLDVDRERNRIMAVTALRDAMAYGERSELDLAQDRLITTIEILKHSLTATDPAVQIQILDLETCLTRFQDRHSYNTSGYAYAEQQYRSHVLQRSVNTNTPSTYLTHTQSSYLH
jgi:uncharacterized protein YegL